MTAWGRCGRCRRAVRLTDRGLVRVHCVLGRPLTCDGSGRMPLGVMS